ncbi:MAG: DUF188 domain-containing protein [Treponema sp.]|nr:DUF188 domain-containing protein [Treponema sp.]
MKILVDADSCPRAARELVLKTSRRRGIPAVFAANRPIPGVSGDLAVMELCPPGENTADDRIVTLARPGDLVITRDLPLAERLAAASVLVLDDRGRLLTGENIKERRSLRDFTVGLAEDGLDFERSPNYGRSELKSFADSLDRTLTRLQRGEAKAPR